MPATMKATVVPEPGKLIETRNVPAQVIDHIAVRLAKAKGMHVAAVDVVDDKPALAKSLGADEAVSKNIGGVRFAPVTAVPSKAIEQANGMLHRLGIVSLVACLPGILPMPNFDIVLKRISIRRSIVGTRLDLAQTLAFAVESSVRTTFTWGKLGNTNETLAKMKVGRMDGSVLLGIAA